MRATHAINRRTTPRATITRATTRSRGALGLGLVLLGGALAARPALAKDRPRSAILAYGKIGTLVPVSKLGAHVSMRIGGGYLLPVLKQRLAAVIDLGYSQSVATETIDDPRLGEAGGSYSHRLIQRDLNLFIGPQGFFRDPFGKLVPYAAVGLDLHFLRSAVDGSGDSQLLGDNQETSTKVGFALRGGVGYRLGPGIITGELTFSWAPITHDVTGEAHLGRFALLVGYTAMFGL